MYTPCSVATRCPQLLALGKVVVGNAEVVLHGLLAVMVSLKMEPIAVLVMVSCIMIVMTPVMVVGTHSVFLRKVLLLTTMSVQIILFMEDSGAGVSVQLVILHTPVLWPCGEGEGHPSPV